MKIQQFIHIIILRVGLNAVLVLALVGLNLKDHYEEGVRPVEAVMALDGFSLVLAAVYLMALRYTSFIKVS